MSRTHGWPVLNEGLSVLQSLVKLSYARYLAYNIDIQSAGRSKLQLTNILTMRHLSHLNCINKLQLPFDLFTPAGAISLFLAVYCRNICAEPSLAVAKNLGTHSGSLPYNRTDVIDDCEAAGMVRLLKTRSLLQSQSAYELDCKIRIPHRNITAHLDSSVFKFFVRLRP
ncbi:hypothetical protein BJX99DRAFT_195697 [Aspergillus californicus]